VHGEMDAQMDRQIDRQMYREMHTYIDGQMDIMDVYIFI
jgi:hypothetical protein